jgi:surfactin family lipopeptide synthetase A/lichenysin synthetase A
MNFTDELLRYKNSEKTAIVFGDEEISYRILIEKAFRFAFYLHQNGKDRVIIKTARSANAVIAALGVMFSGGVFAFIAENSPKEHLESAASDLGNALIIDDNADFQSLPTPPTDFAPKILCESDPVCAVFTSGSTGSPKGALLTYRALCSTVTRQTDYMNLPENSHTASYAAFSFIAAFWELWYPLANGFTLFILSEKIRLDVFALSEFINENAIAYAFLPPDVAEIFSGIYGGGALRFLRVAGGQLRSCKKPAGYEILYSLGMSENAGSVTFLPINSEMNGNIPIGKPFGETEIYLIEGEMAVSGPSLFMGYAGQEELTKKVLIDNPNANGRKLYEKMYISGDLARINADGCFVHTGRRDWIVKINNIKINPLDSERVILETEGVFEAAVLPFYRADNSAYLTCFYSGEAYPENLPKLLKNKLPPAFIPSYFIKTDTLPKNANGKIDRKSLKMPDSEKKDHEFLSDSEKIIAAAFEKILGLKSGSVGRNDAFIRLGGNSLGLMKLQAELNKNSGLSLRYSDIFTAQTPRVIAGLITRNKSVIQSSEIKFNVPYPLTPPERQMWLLWRTGQDNGRYTVRIQTDFDGEINYKKAENALSELTKNYPVLRSYYREIDGIPYHFYSEEKIAFSDVEPKSYDLTKCPIFTAILHKNSLVFTAHHIIADAAAMRVLAEDFWSLYDGETLDFSAQFSDYAASLINYEDDEPFWEAELKDKNFHSLPSEIPPNGTKEYIITLSEKETEKFKNIAAQNFVTPFITFTAAAAKLLSLIEKSDTVCVGVPVSGRDLPETIRTVGMLVRMLPLLISTDNDVIKSTDEKLKNAILHQNYPFERMNEKFGARYDLMVNLIPYPQKINSGKGLSPRIIRGSYPAPAAKLVIDLREEENCIFAVFTYDSYNESTVKNWAQIFKAILFSENHADIIIPIETAETIYGNGNSDDLAEIWYEFFGVKTGNFYELGGTSLKAIRIEEALLMRGLYLSAADILSTGDFEKLAGLITPADEIDWEAE